MSALYLIAETDGTRFAIPASEVDSVVSTGEIVRVPQSASHIAGLTAIRSHVITLIDARAVINETNANVSKGQTLVVVAADDHYYGLAVDDVQDVCEFDDVEKKVGAAFTPVWRHISTGLIELDGRAVVVVDPMRFVERNADSLAA